jgi:hypothetical protein
MQGHSPRLSPILYAWTQMYVLHSVPLIDDQARKREYFIGERPIVALTTKRRPGTYRPSTIRIGALASIHLECLADFRVRPRPQQLGPDLRCGSSGQPRERRVTHDRTQSAHPHDR